MRIAAQQSTLAVLTQCPASENTSAYLALDVCAAKIVPFSGEEEGSIIVIVGLWPAQTPKRQYFGPCTHHLI